MWALLISTYSAHIYNLGSFTGSVHGREVYEVLTYRGCQELFSLLSTVHEICIGQPPPTSIVEYSKHTPNLSIVGGLAPCH
jgi:hypothetical protein